MRRRVEESVGDVNSTQVSQTLPHSNMDDTYELTSERKKRRVGFASLIVTASVSLVVALLCFGLIGWYYISLAETSSRNGTQSYSVRESRGHSNNILLSTDISEEDLTALFTKAWEDDTNKLPNTEVGLTLQNQVQGGKNDQAPERLFGALKKDLTSISQTFKTFIDLLDNYNPSLKSEEEITDQERREVTAFLDAIIKTPQMRDAHEFLAARGIVEYGEGALHEALEMLWFSQYSRSPRYNTTDSSGFEHVFVGEIRNNKALGLHSWIQFYLEEQADRINYLGFIDIERPSSLWARFYWNGKLKKSSGMFVGTSPEFDITVYTVCYLVRPNQKCDFQIMNHPVRVSTFNLNHVEGYHIGSAFIERTDDDLTP